MVVIGIADNINSAHNKHRIWFGLQIDVSSFVHAMKKAEYAQKGIIIEYIPSSVLMKLLVEQI
jgi:uncharacterized membrane protein YecN with MAPEG domain